MQKQRTLKVSLKVKVLLCIWCMLVASFLCLMYWYFSTHHNDLGKVSLVCDDTVLFVESDGTFKWYLDRNNKDKGYLTGILQYYDANNVLPILDKYSEHFWNLTSDTIETMYDEEDKKEDMFIMIIKGQYFVENVDSSSANKSSDTVKYYLGFRHGRSLQTMEQETMQIKVFNLEEYK